MSFNFFMITPLHAQNLFYSFCNHIILPSLPSKSKPYNMNTAWKRKFYFCPPKILSSAIKKDVCFRTYASPIPNITKIVAVFTAC